MSDIEEIRARLVKIMATTIGSMVDAPTATATARLAFDAADNILVELDYAALTAQRDAAVAEAETRKASQIKTLGLLARAEKVCWAVEEWYDPECFYLPRSVVEPLTDWRRTKEG